MNVEAEIRELKRRVGELEGKFDAIDRKLADHDRRFDRVDASLAALPENVAGTVVSMVGEVLRSQ